MSTVERNESLPVTTADTEAQERTLTRPVVHADGPLAFLVDTALFSHLWRVGTAYSRSALVPAHFRGKPDDCFVACQLALRLQVDPFMLMQNMYVIQGKPGLETKLAIALANSRQVFADRIKWQFKGEGMQKSCTAYAHDRQTGEVLEQTVTMAMAKAEGWIDKAGSKWKTLPDLMLQYRSAIFLIRLFAPEVLMGLYSTDEASDIIDVRTEPRGPREPEERTSKADALAERLAQTQQETTAEDSPDDPPFNPPTAEEQDAAGEAPQQSDPDADITLTEWLTEVGEAQSVARVRSLATEAQKIPDAAVRAAIIRACDDREAAIAKTQPAEEKPADPLEWTRAQAGMCVTFGNWKELESKITKAKWGEETKAKAREIVAEVKASKKGGGK